MSTSLTKTFAAMITAPLSTRVLPNRLEFAAWRPASPCGEGTRARLARRIRPAVFRRRTGGYSHGPEQTGQGRVRKRQSKEELTQ